MPPGGMYAGAPENRARPAIDPLFRSAAVEYGNRAVGVVLSGYLDDGTAGLETIRSCGGVCVVQDPDDAEYPDMPRNAMQHVLVDFCLPGAELGALLSELAVREPGRRSAVQEHVAVEAAVAKRVLSDLETVESLGRQAPFNCPGCGGVLWQIGNSTELRFRCHTGHAYTAATLLAKQTEKMEETIWVALRMFEEHRNLLLRMNAEGSANSSGAERLEKLHLHIQRIRTMLRSTGAK
ncbi:chemotaxis protein CheB [Massilia sp. Root418]|uniref:chemotaxis protein CheB n=1 Tax=Massilia sp. Root418 TaxID=1736532 RepID=UPI0012F6D07B|nr:chemotaxis protein CheB [Massilia sp. Root418]